MTEHCDLSLFISCCVETMCLCCTLCENINKISKCVNNNEGIFIYNLFKEIFHNN